MYMQEHCGAWQSDGNGARGRVDFRIFYPPEADPHVASIRVAGDFQEQLGGARWDFANGLSLTRRDRAAGGVFWETTTPQPLPAGFYEYKYLVEFDDGTQRIVTDPCARYGGLSHQNSGIAVGGSSPRDNEINALKGGRRPLTELNVYELMIDDFTAEDRGSRAPLAAVIDRLDDLVALGFNAILFMPWTAWKNPLFDWGYEPFQYFSVETRYATDLEEPQEKISWLKQLVSACHDRGIHVIMDGVFNHVSLDFPYPQLYQDPATCPFTAASFGGTFTGLQDLDFYNECTNELVAEVCRYWIDDFGIDGIRFDNTVNYFVDRELRGIPRLLSFISNHIAERGETNFSLTLEHIDRSAATVTNETAAISFWDNSLHDVTFSALWTRSVDSRLLNALNNRRWLSDGKVPTLYLSNHDHSQAAWQAGARDNVGAVGGWWRVQPFLIALFTSTAVPLCPNGQEFGQDQFLPEDDHGTGRRVTGRPLHWKQRHDAVGRTMAALHTRLAHLRHDHPALSSAQMYPDVWEEWQTEFNPAGVGLDIARQVAIYHRWAELSEDQIENVVVILNFSHVAQTVAVPFPSDGEWVDLLAGFDGGGDTWSVVVRQFRADVAVGSSWGRVLWRINRQNVPG